jgi:hypothetical protein
VNCLKLATAQGRAIKFTVSLQLRTGTAARSNTFDKRMKSVRDYCSSAQIFMNYCGTISLSDPIDNCAASRRDAA